MLRRLAVPLALVCLGAAACAGPPQGPTYYHDAKPVLDAYCNSCHTPGDIAPESLTTYKDVVAIGGAVDQDVMKGTMPPWPPGPGCNHYVGNRSLPDKYKKLLDDWVQGGMAEGDPKDEGAPIHLSDPTHLDRVDLTLQIPTPYTPHLKPDEYRCFVIPWPETTVKYVTGFRIKPGAKQEVHHVIAYVFPAKDKATIEQLDANDPGSGYTCFGDAKGPEQDTRIIGVWAAGGIDKKLPPGVGVKMNPGDIVVLQVHYHTDRPDITADQSAIQLELADTVQRQGVMALFTNFQGWIANPTGMAIPAGDAHVHHEFAIDPTPYMAFLGGGGIPANHAFAVLAVALHMHELGTSATTKIEHPDGTSTCLLHIPHWDFDNQDSFDLQNEVVFHPGDKLYLGCNWDNSKGTKTIYWGNGTNDEMCLSYYVLACPKSDPTCSK